MQNLFFAHLSGLSAFFSRSSKCTQLLDEICQRPLPRVAPTRWQYNSQLVNTVRDALKELFDRIVQHHKDYDEDSVRCAEGFNAHLDDFEFVFLLSSFQGLFEYSDVMFGMLQKKSLDVQFCLAKVDEFCDTIEKERGRFDETYEATVRETGASTPRRGGAHGDNRARYRQLHSETSPCPATESL
jgi:hypothetical protein